MLILLITLVLTAFCSCSTSSSSYATSGMIKADAMETPYGNNVSESLENVLKDSGDVVVYSAGEQLSDRDSDFLDYFQKYYNGQVTFKYCPAEDTLSALIIDSAAGVAPDIVSLNQNNWPKIGIKNYVYNLTQLELSGVEGLTHPELMRYRALTEDNFTLNGECYSVSTSGCVPIIVAVNVDMFDRYEVQSPIVYNEDGSWNFDTFLACCVGISRSTAGNNRIKSFYSSNMGWFMIANDARFVSFVDTVSSRITSDNSIQTLAFLRELYEKDCVSTDSDSFKKGEAAMYICPADEFVSVIDKLDFKWDIVSFPYGNRNVTGDTPGNVSGYAVTVGSDNQQGAVNYIIARNMFDNFYLHTTNGAVWKKDYIVYSTDQLNVVSNGLWRSRNCLFRGVGDLFDEYEKFWSDISNVKIPLDTLISQYDKIIQDNCK